ncbi:MAG: ribonuclease III [Patescibacteria group bacterium]|jgi:ribonuclease-3
MSPFKDISALEKRLGLNFKDKTHLIQALVHRSYLNEHRDFPLGHNERLEFLGDAVLELVITEYLYKNYEAPEGDLTNWRASVVNSQMLAKVAKEMEVESLLYLSKGEAKDKNTKARDQILANTFESITGAIYLEFGFAAASQFILKQLVPELKYILKNKLFIDPKTLFQEKAQDALGVTPHYKVLKETGPDHAKKFLVGLFLNDEKVTEGKGASKQEAQLNAAKAGLEIKKW